MHLTLKVVTTNTKTNTNTNTNTNIIHLCDANAHSLNFQPAFDVCFFMEHRVQPLQCRDL